MIRVGSLCISIMLADPRWRHVKPRLQIRRAARAVAQEITNGGHAPRHGGHGGHEGHEGRGGGGKQSGQVRQEKMIGVLLTNDVAVRRLNSTYRGKHKATDCLSFPSHPSHIEGLENNDDDLGHDLGGLALAFESIHKKACAAGMTPQRYLSFAVIHGTLHLLGATHDTAARAARMRQRETVALCRVGLASPWL